MKSPPQGGRIGDGLSALGTYVLAALRGLRPPVSIMRRLAFGSEQFYGKGLSNVATTGRRYAQKKDRLRVQIGRTEVRGPCLTAQEPSLL